MEESYGCSLKITTTKYPRTEEDINNEIKALYQERNKLRAITGDGHKIEVGMTLYTWDGFGIEEILVPENIQFTETGIVSRGFYIDEDYSDLFVDKQFAIDQALKMA